MTDPLVDPADGFCSLFDASEPDIAVEDVDAWLGSRSYRDSIAAASERILDHGGLDPLELDVATDDPQDSYRLLAALDRALLQAIPTTGVPGSARSLEPIATRYAETGRLDTGANGGALLPRWVTPGRPGGPDELVDVFHSVVRVPDHVWQRVDHVVPDTVVDLPPAPLAALRIGCVPMIDSYDDMYITTEPDPSRYRLAPVPEVVADRVEAVLQDLAATEVTVACAPEAALDDEILERWQTLLSTGGLAAADGHLTWLLVGSGPIGGDDPPANRAVLVHRTGQIIATQDKMFTFTIDEHQLHSWQLEARMPVPPPIQEHLRRGRTLTVVESAAGRIVILICEDAGRIAELGHIIRAVGPSLVFVPLFSKELRRYFWEDSDANKWVVALGARVVVVNSLAVARARAAAGEEVGDDDSPEPGTCLAKFPFDEDRSLYPQDATIGRSTHPTEIAVLELNA